jgi:nicotinamide-nucleotide amidase
LFSGSGRRMSMNNLQQAQRPQGSAFLDQMPGTAPGLLCELQWPPAAPGDATTGTKVIYAVPGVPWEMKEMITHSIIPDLRRRAGISSVIRSRTLRTWGETESGLAEMLSDRITALDEAGNPTLAFLASGAEGLKVRITAKADDDQAADALLAEEEAYLRELLGILVFGVDDETMEFTVVDLLRSRGLRLAVGESLTGGMIGSRICDVPGASEVFLGGVISYATDVKRDLLKVTAESVVSTEAALQMARGARELLGADVGIAATGVAGPDSQEDHPAGTVCLGVSIAAGALGGDPVEQAIETRLPGRRQQVREFSVITLLALLRRALLQDG